jgi:hypothetical protein
MSLNISEQNIVTDLINKIRVKFCRNPNEIHINPSRILYITSFIFKELNNCEYEYECYYSYEYEYYY